MKASVVFRSLKMIRFAAAAVPTLFICRSYLLCCEHVDKLGAYSIPSETGFLISSVLNS